MPLYTYENLKTGRRSVRMVPIARRDSVPGWKRLFEPCRPVPPVTDRPTLQQQQVLAGYKQLEERGQLHTSRYKASEIKKIWSRPARPEPQETAA